MKFNPVWKSVLYALQGAIVGVGASLPGVSGGVLCVAFGIYEPMMALLTHPVQSFKTYYKMFVPFLVGWALGFVFLAKGVEYLFALSPTVALMLFFGLICGTVPELFKKSEKSDPNSSWTPFVITVSLAYLFFHVLENSVSVAIAPSFASFVLCGVLWGLSLIVPGLASSTGLIFLGLFEPLTAGIGALESSVLLQMILFQYLFKVCYEVLLTPVTYVLVGWLKKKENIYGQMRMILFMLFPMIPIFRC